MGQFCRNDLNIFFLFDRVNFMTLAASLIGTTSLIFNAKGNPIGAGADGGFQPALRCDFLHLFNAMIEKQKKEPGDAIVSTVLFDNYREVIHDRVDRNNTGRQVCLHNLEEGNRGATRLPVFYTTHTLMENRRLLTCLV